LIISLNVDYVDFISIIGKKNILLLLLLLLLYRGGRTNIRHFHKNWTSFASS